MSERFIDRLLKMDLPKGQSAFLWGPRKVGKSTFLAQHFPESIRYDLLDTDLLFSLSARPALLREQLISRTSVQLDLPIIIDEIQKVPALLNEVHWLIENRRLGFILCGSSARKLKKTHANMLGGRAWRFTLHPLAYPELDNPDLLTVLNQGLIPSHYLASAEDAYRSLKAYLRDYLKEEILDEGLTRNIPAFTRFFEMLAYTHGEIVNYSKIATDCGVDSKTVKSYFEILVDTLIGDFILPFQRRAGRDIITKSPKFYLFDVGVAGGLSQRRLTTQHGEEFGKALEHFVFMELKAFLSYHERNGTLNYWRTKTGLEVDFVLENGDLAIEVKGSSISRSSDLRSIKAFRQEHEPKQCIVVCNESLPRNVDGIDIWPWKHFLNQLWSGRVLT